MKYAGIGMAVLVAAAVAAYFVGTGMLTGAFAANVPPAPAIGSAMPSFSLTDTAGKTHTLADYKGKILVLNFCSQQCPFSRGADPAISALATKYADKGVAFLGVDSHKDTTVAQIAEHIQSAKISYPIVKDVDNKYADLVGAKVTPELYIIDKEGKLAYHGAPDNRTAPEGTPTKHYAEDALAALTEGKPVEVKEVTAWGCSIKRKG